MYIDNIRFEYQKFLTIDTKGNVIKEAYGYCIYEELSRFFI